MISSTSYQRLVFWIVALGSVALYRLVPHPYNFTPLGALALLSGAKFKSTPLALAIPLLSVFCTDLILGFYPEIPFVYMAFAAVVLVGRLLRNNPRWTKIGAGALGGSTLFFLISNFGVWLLNPIYLKTLPDLARCYILALPFYQWTLLGDLTFVGLFFGAYALIEKTWRGHESRLSSIK